MECSIHLIYDINLCITLLFIGESCGLLEVGNWSYPLLLCWGPLPFSSAKLENGAQAEHQRQTFIQRPKSGGTEPSSQIPSPLQSVGHRQSSKTRRECSACFQESSTPVIFCHVWSLLNARMLILCELCGSWGLCHLAQKWSDSECWGLLEASGQPACFQLTLHRTSRCPFLSRENR